MPLMYQKDTIFHAIMCTMLTSYNYLAFLLSDLYNGQTQPVLVLRAEMQVILSTKVGLVPTGSHGLVTALHIR